MSETLNIHQRLHAVMGEVDYIQKERKQGMNYTIVSHDAVTAKVRPILHKHGVVYYPVSMNHRQDGNRTEVALTVRFANVDEPADFVDVVGLGYGVDNQDKGPGKAISYAVKYCLLKALGLETGDDPDTDNVDHQPGKQQRTGSSAGSEHRTPNAKAAGSSPAPSTKYQMVNPSTGEVVAEYGLAKDFMDALEAEMRDGDPLHWWGTNQATAKRIREEIPLSAPHYQQLEQMVTAVPA